jgi:predicted XRE-type DNA-binding protein
MATPPRSVRAENTQIENRAEVQVTRSHIASTRRAIQDIDQQIDHRRSRVDAVLRGARTLSPDDTIRLIQTRENLNQLHEQSHSLRDQLLSDMPQVPSNAALSSQEKTEIRGLYDSGLYTQHQLADQYGVTQPAISQCVRNPNQ